MCCGSVKSVMTQAALLAAAKRTHSTHQANLLSHITHNTQDNRGLWLRGAWTSTSTKRFFAHLLLTVLLWHSTSGFCCVIAVCVREREREREKFHPCDDNMSLHNFLSILCPFLQVVGHLQWWASCICSDCWCAIRGGRRCCIRWPQATEHKASWCVQYNVLLLIKQFFSNSETCGKSDLLYNRHAPVSCSAGTLTREDLLDRFSQHTRHCRSVCAQLFCGGLSKM